MHNNDQSLIERAERETLHTALWRVSAAAAQLQACSELERDDPLRIDAYRHFRWCKRHVENVIAGIMARYA